MKIKKKNKKQKKNCRSRKPERNLREAIHPTTVNFRRKKEEIKNFIFSLSLFTLASRTN